MAQRTKGTRLAIVEESTEGTPVDPSAGGDYLSLNEGFTMEPNFESLENSEIRASIGQAPPIQGLESPSASIQHYLKASGTEGTAPEHDLLLKAAFGASASASTERTVVSSTAGSASAASTITVGGGFGADFQRGSAVLIKHPASPYEIRPVHSVSTDTLTLGFNVINAPTSSATLGKHYLYKPADSGHPTLTTWLYRGNGADVEMMAGGRVTECTIEASAGELANQSFTLEGIEYYFNPIRIAATDTKIDFTEDAGTRVGTVSAGIYKDPYDFASALETAMNDVATATITVTYSNSTGKYTIAASGTAVFSLLWNSGANAANTVGDAIGFLVAANDTGALTYTADFPIHAPAGSNTSLLGSPHTPSLDSTNPLAVKNQEVFLGTFSDTSCAGVQSINFTLSDSRASVKDICAESGQSGSVVAERAVECNLVLTLQQYESQHFKRFRANDTVRFMYAFGTKSGGNWEAGKCGVLYIPTATISSFAVTDTDGLCTIELTLQAYVDSSGNGEVYLNFL